MVLILSQYANDFIGDRVDDCQEHQGQALLISHKTGIAEPSLFTME